jgi:hypothetical protein
VIVKSEAHRLFEATNLAFERSTQEVVGLAKENAPVSVSRGVKANVGDVQGGLRASITATPIQRVAGGMTRMVGSAARHAAQREFGGVIAPVRKPRLAWIDPTTGQWIVLPKGRTVTQRPGGPRQGYQPWLRPAADQWPRLMDEHLKAIRL